MIKNLIYQQEEGFALCDFSNASHCQALCNLLNQYMADPMGDFHIMTLPRTEHLWRE